MILAVWLSWERQYCYFEITNKRERKNFRKLKLWVFLKLLLCISLFSDQTIQS